MRGRISFGQGTWKATRWAWMKGGGTEEHVRTLGGCSQMETEVRT
jgi:hypothetical protein